MTKDTDSIAKPFRFPDFFHLSLCWWRRDEGRGTDRGEGVRREEGRGAQSKETHQPPPTTYPLLSPTRLPHHHHEPDRWEGELDEGCREDGLRVWVEEGEGRKHPPYQPTTYTTMKPS